VVNTHLNSFASFTQNTSGIACICNENLFLFFVDVDDIASTADRVQHHFFICLLAWILFVLVISQDVQNCRFLWRLLPSQIPHFILALFSSEIIINLQKGLSKPFLFVLLT
jgi:energy-coupling factor transporter transmembrane protein EcfT